MSKPDVRLITTNAFSNTNVILYSELLLMNNWVVHLDVKIKTQTNTNTGLNCDSIDIYPLRHTNSSSKKST